MNMPLQIRNTISSQGENLKTSSSQTPSSLTPGSVNRPAQSFGAEPKVREFQPDFN